MRLGGLYGSRVALLLGASLFVVLPSEGPAQEVAVSGLEITGLPAVNFDADEGFGYGALFELYQYGQLGRAPYDWTLQPSVFLTTEGRRDFTLFLDAPHVLRRGWRLTAFLGNQKQIANPYYGFGNASAYDRALEAEDGPNPYFYRFGRTVRSATFALQKGLVDRRLRALIAAGIVRTEVDPFPGDEGTTLFAQDYGAEDDPEWTNYVRGGLIWDTRDRESGPRSGSWTELLVHWVDEGFGATVNFSRWTFADRRYFSLADRLVFAHRYQVQSASSQTPIFELFRIQSSFKQREGLGGAKTVRGLYRNRFVGRSSVIWNAELRWRVTDFEILNRSLHVVLSGFVDHGRVWDDRIQPDELFADLHRGAGGGFRVGVGENFIAALDLGHSTEAGLQMYIGTGYLY